MAGAACLPPCRLKPPAAQSLAGVRYACERRLGEHWSLSREILLASGLQHASSDYWFCNLARASRVCALCAAVVNTAEASCSSAPRAPHQPAAKFDSWQFGPRQPPRPEIQNDEHLLPLAGREPGPNQTRRGEPRGEPADHDALRKASPPRGSRSSTRTGAGELPITSRIRSPTEPEATHPPEQFLRFWKTETNRGKT